MNSTICLDYLILEMVKNNKNIRLCLVLTEGMSFQLWDEYGLLKREISLYKKLLNFGIKTTFVSFGNRNELKYKKCVKAVRNFH